MSIPFADNDFFQLSQSCYLLLILINEGFSKYSKAFIHMGLKVCFIRNEIKITES